MEVLHDGGSAADAAIAAALTLGVVAPDCSGIGGGGFALVWNQNLRRVTALDFREAAPAHVRPFDVEREIAQGSGQLAGALVGVPGEVAGLFALHSQLGRLPIDVDFGPAIRIAEAGYAVSSALARNAFQYRPVLSRSPLLASLFASAGVGPVLAGSRLTREHLAVTLRRIARTGPGRSTRGPSRKTSCVRAVPLAAGSPRKTSRPTVSKRGLLCQGKWEGLDVFTMPAPSAGGLLLLETLAMSPRADLVGLGLNTGGYVHYLAEAFRGAMTDRVRAMGDPSFVTVKSGELLDAHRLHARRAAIAMERTHALPESTLNEHGTSHLVVYDGEGNVVSLTTTVGDAFGARIAAEESGVILNDELVDFTVPSQYAAFQASSKNPFAFSPNRPRASARPVSSMTPAIVVRDGRVELALGGAGGLRIPTAVAQVFLAHEAFQVPLSDAVALPRFQTPYDGPTVELEQGTGGAVLDDLRGRGERLTVAPNFSAVQVISASLDPSGAVRLAGAADPRFGGEADTR